MQSPLSVYQYTTKAKTEKIRDRNQNFVLERASKTDIIKNFIKTYYNKIKSATLWMTNKTFNTNGFFDFNYYYCFTIGLTMAESISEMQCAFSKLVRQRNIKRVEKLKWILWMHFITQNKITATMDAFIVGQALLFIMFSDCKIM